jgi:ankyrin repeat protein
MPIAPELKKVLDKYKDHPQFLGLELIDPNQKGAVDDTPLHIAAQTGALYDIEILVVHGAEVNAIGDLGDTPLHCAARHGHVAAVEKLISLGAKPNALNEFSETPLELARLCDHLDTAAILTKYK